MPVLSPHRSSGLTGSYRSTYSSALDRPYYGSSISSITPRVSSYSERFTSRSYTDVDGRRVFSRSGSITEDGITSRFREESREGSLSRDSGIRSIRENSVLDYSRRDSSLSRSGVDSVTELRNKYSPANYVPAIYRNQFDNISRSKSINDIGLPPIEPKATCPTALSRRKQVTSDNVGINLASANSNNANGGNPSHNIKSSGNNAYNSSNIGNNENGTVGSGNTNGSLVNLSESDRNGNLLESVADLCKRLDEKQSKVGEKAPQTAPARVVGGRQSNRGPGEAIKIHRETSPSPSVASRHRAQDSNNSGRTSPSSLCNGRSSLAQSLSSGLCIEDSPSNDDSFKDEEVQENPVLQTIGRLENGNSSISDKMDEEHGRRSSRVNQYASFISNDPKSDDLESKNEKIGRKHSYNVNDSNTGYISLRSRLGSSSRFLSSDDGTVQAIDSNGLGLAGLKNIGNTCFMNSVLQCLSNTKLLLKYIRYDEYKDDLNSTTSSLKGVLFKVFADLITELWSPNVNMAVNTQPLKSQIQKISTRFAGYQQQDSQEFLRYILEGLHEDVNRVKVKPKAITTEIDDNLPDAAKAAEAWRRYVRTENSFVVDVFVGQLKSTLRCTFCGHCSVTFDPFWDLSVPIPENKIGLHGSVRLAHCLEAFTKEETLDGDEKPTCSKCNERRKCTKNFTIQRFPQVLVIHLKRFSQLERFKGKLSTLVEFPLEKLDLKQYAAEPENGAKYNLYAVSAHSGTAYSGHYISFCRNALTGSWYEYNDSRVTPCSERTAVCPEAYVLFYERTVDSPNSKL